MPGTGNKGTIPTLKELRVQWGETGEETNTELPSGRDESQVGTRCYVIRSRGHCLWGQVSGNFPRGAQWPSGAYHSLKGPPCQLETLTIPYPSVFCCQGCCNKAPYTGYLKQKKRIVTLLEPKV